VNASPTMILPVGVPADKMRIAQPRSCRWADFLPSTGVRPTCRTSKGLPSLARREI
jgi:hypothetical protein